MTETVISEGDQTGYRENLFDGKFSTEAGLGKLRKGLLDLTNKNRLLNYRFPKSKSLRVIDTPPDRLYSRLVEDGNSVKILPVPEPSRKDYKYDEDGHPKKPNVKTFAEFNGIETEYELKNTTIRIKPWDIQTLYYAEDLEAVIRKIDQAARTAIEESGTNMLYLVFGFLEWYESNDSDTPMLAPLLIIPVSLKRGPIIKEIGHFQYILESIKSSSYI